MCTRWAGRKALDVMSWNLKLEWRQVSSREPLKTEKYSMGRKKNLSAQSRERKSDTEVCIWEQELGRRKGPLSSHPFFHRKEHPPNSTQDSCFHYTFHIGLMRRKVTTRRARLFPTPLVCSRRDFPSELPASWATREMSKGGWSPRRSSPVQWSLERHPAEPQLSFWLLLSSWEQPSCRRRTPASAERPLPCGEAVRLWTSAVGSLLVGREEPHSPQLDV